MSARKFPARALVGQVRLVGLMLPGGWAEVAVTGATQFGSKNRPRLPLVRMIRTIDGGRLAEVIGGTVRSGGKIGAKNSPRRS
jgi:hypothetical protein